MENSCVYLTTIQKKKKKKLKHMQFIGTIILQELHLQFHWNTNIMVFPFKGD